MRPPYHPEHVEALSSTNGNQDALPRCSCGWIGDHHKLGEPGTAARIIAEFNTHRETYVVVSSDKESQTAS